MAPLSRLRRLSRLAPLALAAALLAAACGGGDGGGDCEALAMPVAGPAPGLASAAGGTIVAPVGIGDAPRLVALRLRP